MKRTLILLYGLIAYGLFHVTFLYLIGFVVNYGVPKSIDASGPTTDSLSMAMVVNLSLIAAFGVQHAIMARRGFKAWLTRFVPSAIERSTFVLATCAALGLLYWQWRPIDTVVWSVEQPGLAMTVWAVCGVGWAVALVSTFLIDHFELFGLRQTFAGFRGVSHVPPRFLKRGFYRHVRHPLMFGLLLAFWATPMMTFGHLLFCIGMTGYVYIGVTMEERDLMTEHPASYAAYRRETAMLIPGPRRKAVDPTQVG